MPTEIECSFLESSKILRKGSDWPLTGSCGHTGANHCCQKHRTLWGPAQGACPLLGPLPRGQGLQLPQTKEGQFLEGIDATKRKDVCMTTILNTTFLKIKVLLPEICWQNTSNIQIPRPSTTRRVFWFLEKARVTLANTLNGGLHGLFVLSRTWCASRLSSAHTCPFLTDHSCLPNVFTSSQVAPSRGILPTHAPVKILPSQNCQLVVGTAKTIRFPNSHDGHDEGRQEYVPLAVLFLPPNTVSNICLWCLPHYSFLPLGVPGDPSVFKITPTSQNTLSRLPLEPKFPEKDEKGNTKNSFSDLFYIIKGPHINNSKG